MNIILPMYKHWSDMILSGEKTLEFRTKVPTKLQVGDKIFTYESGKYGGSKEIVGECTYEGKIDVLSPEGKWPMLGAYPFIDYFFEYVKHDAATAQHYRQLKEEFDKYKNYKYGFILGYAMCPEELESLRTTGQLIDTWKIHDMNYVKLILDGNAKSDQHTKMCDDWLTRIGFYNEMCESYYKYAFILSNPIRYATPKPLSDFTDIHNNPIAKAPQSFMYTTTN